MKTIKEKAQELLEKCEVISVASVDENGFPRPVPMSKIKSEGLHTIWLSTGTNSEKTRHFQKNNKAGICFFEGGDSVFETGIMDIITDADIKKALWQDWFIAHFPGGPEDPEYCILKFKGEKATFWIDSEFTREEF